MANIWIRIAGNDGVTDTTLVVEDGHFFSASNIIYKSISFSENILNIDFRVLKGENVSNSDIYLRETIDLSQAFTNQSLLDRILFFFIKRKTVLDTYTVLQKDGKIQTTLMCGNFKKSFTIFTINHIENASVRQYSQVKDNIKIDLTKDFLKAHIHDFSTLLEETFLISTHNVNDNSIMTKWREAIIALPDSSTMTSLFDRCNNNVALWLNTLNTLGIQRDKCRKYSAHTLPKDKYHTPSDTTKEYYTVIRPCWTYTPSGENQCIVLIKGFIE